MRKSVVLFLLLGLFNTGKSQQVELGLGLGTGIAYLVEDKIQFNEDTSYPFSFGSYVSLKYAPQLSYFDYKLKFQYVNSSIKGRDPQSGAIIDGEVVSFSTFILLEHIKNSKKWNIGYNVGFGYTSEDYVQRFYEYRNRHRFPETRKFMSIQIAGLVSVRASEQVAIQFSPLLFWTDVVNTFRSDNWILAGEDVSVLFQVGVIYRLKKNNL